MTKGLKSLKRIRQETCPATYMNDFDKNQCCDDIEKELKALEIIKDKQIDVAYLKHIFENENRYIDPVNEYNKRNRKITGIEYDLLKEVLQL